MGAPFGVFGFRLRRPLHSARYRIAVVILISCLIQQQRLFFIYRTALAAKYSPTYFDSGFGRIESRLPSIDENSHLQQDLLQHRDSWRVLGSGWEGSVYTYNDVAIKTFKTKTSPFRNCAACDPHSRWPTEIPASLYFGNLLASGITNSSIVPSPDDVSSGFLPVRSHFLATDAPGLDPEWHLVTPLVPEGTLKTLSKKIRMMGDGITPNDLDIVYRPAFNRLLRTLDSMHRAGFCHDDIKPDNIFVKNSTQWLLGDLGNVRHINHAYHSSRLWTNNKQLPDCRANDALRAMKSYLKFLRSAVNEKAIFDEDFLAGRTPVTKLYGSIVADSQSLSAEALYLRSSTNPFEPAASEDSSSTDTVSGLPFADIIIPVIFSREHRSERAVKRELRISLSEGVSRFFAMTKIFGVPETLC